MNIDLLVIGPDLRALMSSVPQKEYDALFDSMQKAEEAKLISTPKEELTDLKARVTIISEIRFTFAQVREALVNKEKQ